jgi:hypothetical protein
MELINHDFPAASVLGTYSVKVDGYCHDGSGYITVRTNAPTASYAVWSSDDSGDDCRELDNNTDFARSTITYCRGEGTLLGHILDKLNVRADDHRVELIRKLVNGLILFTHDDEAFTCEPPTRLVITSL